MNYIERYVFGRHAYIVTRGHVYFALENLYRVGFYAHKIPPRVERIAAFALDFEHNFIAFCKLRLSVVCNRRRKLLRLAVINRLVPRGSHLRFARLEFYGLRIERYIITIGYVFARGVGYGKAFAVNAHLGLLGRIIGKIVLEFCHVEFVGVNEFARVGVLFGQFYFYVFRIVAVHQRTVENVYFGFSRQNLKRFFTAVLVAERAARYRSNAVFARKHRLFIAPLARIFGIIFAKGVAHKRFGLHNLVTFAVKHVFGQYKILRYHALSAQKRCNGGNNQNERGNNGHFEFEYKALYRRYPLYFVFVSVVSKHFTSRQTILPPFL